MCTSKNKNKKLIVVPEYTKQILLQVDFSYGWISLFADVGGWTSTLIGLRCTQPRTYKMSP
jgi:hypothetical protein